ncbi:unknown [Mycoplasma sp. CAG:877]|jgi:hypothetical protein|nr:unknown [Mycoplasma sp. CAG:877]
MKKTISLKKNLEFPSMIGEITAISLDHNLKFQDESNIAGEFKVTGNYKLTEASRLEEKFDYTIPVEIALTEKLDLSTTKISISDFYYEIENDDTMVCNIELKIEGVEIIEVKEEQEQPSIEPIKTEEKPNKEDDKMSNLKETRECDANLSNEEKEIPEMPTPKIDKTLNSKTQEQTVEITQVSEKEETTKNVGSLFSSLDSSEETFSTYSVYILRQEETIQSLIEKYHVTKEELENYNDLSNLTIGSKIIIPNTTND